MTDVPSGGSIGSAICPTCGAGNRLGSRFCERCGTRLPQIAREVTGPPPSPPTDATLTFERPTEPAPRDTHESPATATDGGFVTPTAAEPFAHPPADDGPTNEPGAEPSVQRDAPTMSFDLPTLPTPLANEERSAPTVSFDLPRLDPSADAPAEAHQRTDAASSAARDASAPEADKWDYQPWKPQRPGELSAATGDLPEQGATRPTPAQPMPAPNPVASTPARPESAPAPPSPPPPPGQAPYQPQAPGWYGGPPPAAPVAQGSVTYPTPGDPSVASGQAGSGGFAGGPPAYGYPQGGAPAWNPPNAGAYPAPATSGSNRTLWIILGVVGGLLLLCAMICVLLILVGAVSASSSGAVATSVATATRP